MKARAIRRYGWTTIWETDMSSMTGISELRTGKLLGHPAQRVTLRCEHGESTHFLLPGRDPTANDAAVDYLWVRHVGRHGCECLRAEPSDRGARID